MFNSDKSGIFYHRDIMLHIVCARVCVCMYWHHQAYHKANIQCTSVCLTIHQGENEFQATPALPYIHRNTVQSVLYVYRKVFYIAFS